MRKDVSGWTTQLTDALIAENTASGIWRNQTLADQLAGRAARRGRQSGRCQALFGVMTFF